MLRRIAPHAVVVGLALGPLPSGAAPPFDCGPFLLQPGTDRMTVVVDHAAPVAAALTVWAADGGPTRTLRHDKAVRHHIFALDGLAPATRYRYRVQGGGADSGERELCTLPTAPRAYRFLALGDVRTYPETWRRVAQRIHDHEPEALFIVGTGDYPADGRQYDQWVAQFFAPARDLLARVPLWPAIGNHERTRQHVSAPPPDDEAGAATAEASHYFSLFELPGNERWFRVDYQYLTLLILDSNSQLAPGHDQYEWLLEQLRSDRQRFTVVAFHHDPVTSGPHGRRLEDGTFREWPLDQAWRFLLPLFELYGADLVLNGHDHTYERSHKAGVYYVVTGGGGAPLYEVNDVDNPYQQVARSANHYVAVDVTPASLAVGAIGIDGDVLDWFVIPVSERAARRRAQAAVARVREGLILTGDRDAVAGRAVNPLGFPLAVELSVSPGAADPPQRAVLAPGAAADLRVPLRAVPGIEQPAWRGRIGTTATLRLTGEDDGIPVAGAVELEVVLREARYVARPMPTPVVDGAFTDWPADVEAMVLDSASTTVANRQAYGGDADLRVSVRAGWSAAGLHLAVAVEDEALVDAPERPVWESDGVELYVDGRPAQERPPTYGPGVSQLVLPALRPVAGQLEGNRAWEADDLAWMVRPRDGGYDLEATLPFDRIREAPWRPAAGDSLRFDLMVNDRDDLAGTQSHHRLWSTGSAAATTAGYGVVVLGD